MPKVFKDENRIRKIYKGSQKMRKAYYRDMVVYSAREDYSDTVDTKNVLHTHSTSNITTATSKTGCADTGYSSPIVQECTHQMTVGAAGHQWNTCPVCGQTSNCGYGEQYGSGTVCGQSYSNMWECGSCGSHWGGVTLNSWGKHNVSTPRTLYKCTRTTSTVVGTCYMTKTTTEEDTYKLKANVTSVTATAYAWSNGATTQEVDVTSNGTYTCNVTVKEPTGSSHIVTLTYEVTDY